MDHDVHEYTHLQVRWITDCETRKNTVHITCTNYFLMSGVIPPSQSDHFNLLFKWIVSKCKLSVLCNIKYAAMRWRCQLSLESSSQVAESTLAILLSTSTLVAHFSIKLSLLDRQVINSIVFKGHGKPLRHLQPCTPPHPTPKNVSIFLPINILIMSTQHYHPFLIC